jgi:hypothetical protein
MVHYLRMLVSDMRTVWVAKLDLVLVLGFRLGLTFVLSPNVHHFHFHFLLGCLLARRQKVGLMHVVLAPSFSSFIH